MPRLHQPAPASRGSRAADDLATGRTSSYARTRRALLQDFEQDKRGWLRHGIAALAVTVLGLGVAGSVALTGAAQEHEVAPRTEIVRQASSPSTPDTSVRQSENPSRNTSRAPLNNSQITNKAAERAKSLGKTSAELAKAARNKAAQARTKELETERAATAKNANGLGTEAQRPDDQIQGGATAGTPGTDASQVPVTGTSGSASLPITSGYTVAAKFGQIGPWARYHTGYDFAAPIGTPIHAPADGVVTHVGYGSAAGWAGFYVTVKHADGTQTLYAHTAANAVVSVGQQVTTGQIIAHIGMTGRTFGPHLHFEVYPVGVNPGDVYRAVDPSTWLIARGLHP